MYILVLIKSTTIEIIFNEIKTALIKPTIYDFIKNILLYSFRKYQHNDDIYF